MFPKNTLNKIPKTAIGCLGGPENILVDCKIERERERERERESPTYLPNYTYFSIIILHANQTLKTIFQNTTKQLKIVSFQKIF